MTTPPPDQPTTLAVGAAAELARALGGVEERLQEAIDQKVAESEADSRARDAALARRARQNRMLIVIAIIGLCIDVAATAVAIVALTAAHHNAATVAQVHQSNLDGCNYNNTRLANQAKALDQILSLAHASPAFEAQGRAAVALGWAPRNCPAAYKLP